MKRSFALLAALVLVALVNTTCSSPGPAEPGYTQVAPASLAPGDPVPAPTNDVVLTLTGAIGTTNTDTTLDFDMETLEQIGLVAYTVDDPHTNETATYQGVLLADVLRVAGVDPDSDGLLQARALDEYQVDIPFTVLRWPVMLATRQDNQPFAIADKGPIRVVFPYHYAEIDPVVHDPLWIWQLRTLEVR